MKRGIVFLIITLTFASCSTFQQMKANWHGRQEIKHRNKREALTGKTEPDTLHELVLESIPFKFEGESITEKIKGTVFTDTSLLIETAKGKGMVVIKYDDWKKKFEESIKTLDDPIQREVSRAVEQVVKSGVTYEQTFEIFPVDTTVNIQIPRITITSTPAPIVVQEPQTLWERFSKWGLIGVIILSLLVALIIFWKKRKEK